MFQAAIADAGGVKALVNLIFKWTSGVDGVLVCPIKDRFMHNIRIFLNVLVLSFMFKQERAAGALANLAADDKCSVEIAMAGGVRALVTLARTCKVEGVQEQV